MFTTKITDFDHQREIITLQSKNRQHMKILHILAKENGLAAETTVEIAAKVVNFQLEPKASEAQAKKDARADIKAAAKSD